MKIVQKNLKEHLRQHKTGDATQLNHHEGRIHPETVAQHKNRVARTTMMWYSIITCNYSRWPPVGDV
jgi:hypothetical protein